MLDPQIYPILSEYGHNPYKTYQRMNQEGEIDNLGELDNDKIKEIYTWMLKMKAFDAVCINLQRTGRMGTYPSIRGQEACQIGSVYGLDKKDWFVPTFRESGSMWFHGIDPVKIMLYWIGNEKGSEFSQENNVLPIQICVGAHLPHAVGLGWAERLKKGKQISVCSFSDGATSEGDFHSALNFAGVYDTRTIFFLQNNKYAISTHTALQTKSKNFAIKAESYGITGIKVDGNDIIAIIEVMQEAQRLARDENKSILIEAVTYRLLDHTTSDNSKLYREDKEVEEEKLKDPIIRLEKYLKKNNLITDQEIESINNQAKKEAESYAEIALNTSDPEPEDMFKYLLSTPYKDLETQMNSVRENI